MQQIDLYTIRTIHHILLYSTISYTLYTIHRFSKDQSAAMAKLQAIILELKEGMNGRDEALLKAVEALVSICNNVY